MIVRLIVLPAVALSLVVTAFASATVPARVTIAAQPVDLARDRKLTLFGTIASNRAQEVVTLEARDCGQSTFREVARVPVGVGGRWSWEFFYPGITATIRASWRGSTSVPIRVRDRAFVELRQRDHEFAVSVRAQTPFGGKRVLLQRLTPRGWRTVRSAVLATAGAPPGSSYVTSTARVRGTVARGTLVRAVFPRPQARPCYLAGYSNMLRA
jgi:hypothetical protein